MTYGPWSTSPLRGRDEELAALRTVLRKLPDGRGGSALLLAEAGGGKTRLVQEVADLAQGAGYVVARIYADELDSLAPMGTLLYGLCGIADALEGSAVLSGAIERISTGVSVVQDIQSVLERTSATVPVVVVVDDVDRADDLTLHALRLLIQALQSSSVAWFLTARAGPAPRLARLRATIARTEGPILSLPPLSATHSRQITEDLLGRPAPEAVNRRVLAAGGNPFLLTELVRAVDNEQSATPESVIVPTGNRLPLRALEAVHEHLAQLSVETRHVLEVAAVLGRCFHIADVLGVMGNSLAEQFTAVRQLLDSGVVIERDGRMLFAHDLLRETVLAELPAELVRLLHKEAATYLLARGNTPVDVASHLLAGVGPEDTHMAGVLLEAGIRLASATPAQAVELAHKALIVSADRHEQWLGALPDAISILIHGGALDEASATLAAGVGRGLDREAEANIRVELCEGLWQQGRTAEAMAVVHAFDRSTVSPASAVRLDVAAARIKLLGGRPQEAISDLTVSLRSAEETGDARTRTQILVSQAMALRFTGDLLASIDVAHQAVASLQGQPEWHGVDPRVWLARSLVATDRFEEASFLLRDLTRNAQATEGLRDLPPSSASSARLHLARGQLHDAVTEAESGVAAMDATGRRELAADLFACAATAHWLTDGVEAADEVVRRAGPYIEHNSFRMNHLALARVLTRADYDSGAVVDLAQAMLRDLDHSYGQLIFDPMNGPALARVFSRLGMVQQVDRVLAASRRLANQNHDVRCWLASALHVEGLRSRDVAALLTAAERFDDCERPLAAALALTDALHEARHRAHSKVSQVLRRARNRLEELGAAAAADHLEMASPHRGSRGRPIAGWQSLTPAELRVVNLAATGATNKEIAEELWISPYTVDTHMRHSLAKLGLRSRVALARLAAQHELGAETDAGGEALTSGSPQSGRQAARGPKRTPEASGEQHVGTSSSASVRRPR